MASGVAITGSGVWAPEPTISNDELAASFNKFVEISNDRNAAKIAAGEMEALKPSSAAFIEKASGILQRHVIDKVGILDPERMCPNFPDRANDEVSVQAEMALNAINIALEKAGRKGSDVDMVVLSSATIQRQYPAVAMEVQHHLGASGFAYDSSVACSAATYAIQAASDAIKAGNASCVVVVSPEVMSAQTNWRDRDSHFIFGDATTALVLERADDRVGSGYEILSTKLLSVFSSNIRNNFGVLNRLDSETQFSANKLFMQQGRRVFKDIVPLASKFITEHLEETSLKANQIKRFWLHQANIKMNDLIAKRVLGAEMSRELAPSVLDRYANTASCGSIIAFDEYREDFREGDLGCICSFGAGYSIGGVIVKRLAD